MIPPQTTHNKTKCVTIRHHLLNPAQLIGADSVLAAQCKELVSDYLPMIVDSLARMVPEQVCVSIGLCGNQDTSTARRLMGMPGPLHEMRWRAGGASTLCSMCELVVTEVQVRCSGGG